MKLPSIHTLLNPPPSPPTCNNNNSHASPPTVQILPASPIPSSTMDNATLSPMLSPALSSTRSPSVSSVDSVSPMAMESSEFPPIHGDDPPRRLVHATSPSPPQPRSPTHYLHHSHYHHHHHHRTSSSHSEPLSPSSYGFNNTKDHTIHASTASFSPGANTLPTPPTTYRPAPSIVVSQSSSPILSSLTTTTTAAAAVGPSQQFLTPNQAISTNNNGHRSPSPSRSRSPSPLPSSSPSDKESVPAPPPCTQILISPTGQPILKRRRGRPPTRSPGYDEGGWTFLSPTVWDVTSSSQQQQQQQKEGSPQPASPHQRQQGTMMTDNDTTMTESMTAFTGADMDTVLPMPKKKRGRKPKTHIEGNSCFIWKDIGATTRRSTTS